MGQAVNLLCNKQIAVNDVYRENYDRIFKKKDGDRFNNSNNHVATNTFVCPESKNLKRVTVGVCMRCDKRLKCQVYQQQTIRLMGFRY